MIDRTEQALEVFWPKNVIERTQELIALEAANEKKTRKKKKAAKGSPEAAERKRDEHGRWLRTAKIGPATGKHVLTIQVPRTLMDKVISEADDVDYGHAKMLVVLAQLGLPIWQKYRGELMLEQEPEYCPAIIKAIVRRAQTGTKKRPSFVLTKVRKDVQKEIEATAQRLKESRSKRKKDPTNMALEHFGELE